MIGLLMTGPTLAELHTGTVVAIGSNHDGSTITPHLQMESHHLHEQLFLAGGNVPDEITNQF
jgi:hypothetical protein